ncbi:MAG: VWA domain-containing protein [Candidatus Margulisbacteria bacterium]|nr:VWA domain-containing protein [Candidatus Margulisiibacteriota bacterium]MBU1021684.1 VWA domain-containing protein [Candidatus Margulisiibacteriota bacterium]MBU1729562.1 VWA domain-containing protein [Candidatus Margulisiibacteriota bacterium]MBU1955048.1 VWA domain-containing protein [Candidatus Margulisiibacteriota bacterium]
MKKMFKFLPIVAVFLLMAFLFGCSTSSGGGGEADPGRVVDPSTVLTASASWPTSGRLAINIAGLVDSSGEAVTGATYRAWLSTTGAASSDGTEITLAAPSGRLEALDIDTPIDILHILDATGSMVGEITAVKNSMNDFFSTLEAAGLNVQVGVFTYWDTSTEAIAQGYERGFFNLTDSSADVASYLNNVVATGGGGFPENPMSPLLWAYNGSCYPTARFGTPEVTYSGVNWRPGAVKIFIITTDARMHYSGDGSSEHDCTVTSSEVIAGLDGGATIYAVSPLYTTQPESDARELALASGGTWAQMPSSGDVDYTALGISAILEEATTLLSDITLASSVTEFWIHLIAYVEGVEYADVVIHVVESAGTPRAESITIKEIFVPGGQINPSSLN